MRGDQADKVKFRGCAFCGDHPFNHNKTTPSKNTADQAQFAAHVDFWIAPEARILSAGLLFDGPHR